MQSHVVTLGVNDVEYSVREAKAQVEGLRLLTRDRALRDHLLALFA